MSDDIVTIADVRKAGYCVRGSREAARLRGIDFKDFLKNGIPVKKIEHMNDAMVQHILRVKRGEKR